MIEKPSIWMAEVRETYFFRDKPSLSDSVTANFYTPAASEKEADEILLDCLRQGYLSNQHGPGLIGDHPHLKRVRREILWRNLFLTMVDPEYINLN